MRAGPRGQLCPGAQQTVFTYFYLQVTFKELGQVKLGRTRSPGAEGRPDMRSELGSGSNTECFSDGTNSKNLPAKAGVARDSGSVPGSGRCPGVGNGNPL